MIHFPQGEKYLVLKKKYRHDLDDLLPTSTYSPGSPLATPDFATLSPNSSLRDPPPYRPPPPAPLSPSSGEISSPSRTLSPPPEELYATVNKSRRTSVDQSSSNDGYVSYQRQDERANRMFEETESVISSPPVPPRRKSQDKMKLENKENINVDRGNNDYEVIKVSKTIEI